MMLRTDLSSQRGRSKNRFKVFRVALADEGSGHGKGSLGTERGNGPSEGEDADAAAWVRREYCTREAV